MFGVGGVVMVVVIGGVGIAVVRVIVVIDVVGGCGCSYV